jgi:diadenosine tetraphosphate (Ap4A) HIT family hydrolase
VSAAPTSACAVCAWEVRPRPAGDLVVVESDRWIVRHHMHPAPLVGWLQLISRRHVQGPAHFDRSEAAEFGIALHEVSSALERYSGALRVYAIAFGEGSPHLHVHLVPRMPGRDDTAAWKVADWYRAVERGEQAAADPARVAALIEALRAALSGGSSEVGWCGPRAP